MDDRAPVLPENVAEPITTAADSFEGSAYLKILKPQALPEENPIANTPFAEPTNSERVKTNRHHNFVETFMRPPFTGK